MDKEIFDFALVGVNASELIQECSNSSRTFRRQIINTCLKLLVLIIKVVFDLFEALIKDIFEGLEGKSVGGQAVLHVRQRFFYLLQTLLYQRSFVGRSL